MRITLCNEVLRDLSFAEQCLLAAQLGYDGLEIAPFTLSENPGNLSASDRAMLRRMAEDAGLKITGLHFLMLKPEGLSITNPDPAIRERTRTHMLQMVELCSDLGGSVLVHGSPTQRRLSDAPDRETARANALELFQEAGDAAAKAGLVYCIEPLSPAVTDFITSVAEAAELLRLAGSPGLSAMIDTLAVWTGEEEEPQTLLRHYLPQGLIRHVHLNESNSRVPGQGDHSFVPILRELLHQDYQGMIGVEPFDYHPDGPTAAALAIGYLGGVLSCLGENRVSGSASR